LDINCNVQSLRKRLAGLARMTSCLGFSENLEEKCGNVRRPSTMGRLSLQGLLILCGQLTIFSLPLFMVIGIIYNPFFYISHIITIFFRDCITKEIEGEVTLDDTIRHKEPARLF
jgi:hypothetical protein